MCGKEKIQLSMLVEQGNPRAILWEVRDNHLHHYSAASFAVVERSFDLIVQLFHGSFPGYLACNTEYHNLSHTLDAFLAASRLVDGMAIAGRTIQETTAANLLLAALFHDTGYIQEESDNAGTGAKYTRVHVDRSIQFVKTNHAPFGIDAMNVPAICSIIGCTGLRSECAGDFLADDVAAAGAILGTADLLGQMSDRAYLEKLLFLYYEFREAGIEGFDTEFDILRKTLDFYEGTMTRLNTTLKSCYAYAARHFEARYAIAENLYITAIENQMQYLRDIINDEAGNFRGKLKRLDIEKMENRYLAV